MLNQFPAPADGAHNQTIDAGAYWIDLVNPTPDDIARVEKVLNAPIPSLGALSEIETSSRLRRDGDVLYLSTPSAARRPEDAAVTPPIGFVLSRDRLVTVRFMPLPAFDAVAHKFSEEKERPRTSLDVFTALCEEIVDRVADILEHIGKELNMLSAEAFRAEDPRGHHAARANRLLRVQLRQTGRLGERLSEIRDGLQGLGRIASFSQQHCKPWCEAEQHERLASLDKDIHSLVEYEEQLSGKVQFVLDALVGLIGIAQNDLFKILTIVSIVGIPPTLMAGVYGMNFKNMPEYDWAWGYPYGWAMIILSALIPVVWFKVRGWF